MKLNLIYGLEEYEIITNCYNKDCDNKFIIWKDAGKYKNYFRTLGMSNLFKEIL